MNKDVDNGLVKPVFNKYFYPDHIYNVYILLFVFLHCHKTKLADSYTLFFSDLFINVRLLK